MVIGLEIGKLHRGGGGRNPPSRDVLDSKEPGLFRVKIVGHIMMMNSKWFLYSVSSILSKYSVLPA